jgi:hypothetical protein
MVVDFDNLFDRSGKIAVQQIGDSDHDSPTL